MRRRTAVATLAVGLALLPACGGGTDEASRAAGITPTDALALVSVNLDPSIAQKRNLLAIARRFPDAREEVKGEFDETRDGLLAALLEDSGLDFGRDVKPWLGDEVALVVLPPGSEGPPLVLALVETDDAGRARAAIDKATRAGEFSGAYRVVGDFVVISDQDDEAADARALDAVVAQSRKDDGGLARSAEFTRVVDRLHGDRLLLAWVDVKGAVGVAEGLGALGGVPLLGSFRDKASAFALDLHVEEAAVVLQAVAPATTDQAPGGDARLTRSLPAASLGALTVFNLRRGAGEALRAVTGSAGVRGGDPLAELEQSFGVDLEADLLSWMEGEAVVVAGPAPAGGAIPRFALVVAASDRAGAAAGLEKLRTALTSRGVPLEPRPVAGATAHVASQPLTEGIQPAMGLFGERFVLASDPGYLETLASAADPGLGAASAYRSVLGEGGGRASFQFVALLDPIREALERAVLGDQAARRDYERDVKPNVEPLSAFGIVARRDGDFDEVQMRLTFD